jgi:cytidylate kinase
MTLVALSASYGAGGSRIGPALAERLGVPFLDRAIPLAVAERLAVPYDDAAAHDEQAGSGRLERLLRGFVGGDTLTPAPVLPDAFRADDFREATEAELRRQAQTGEGVLLGRGAALVLRDDPRVLRVRLDGPPEARLRQAMELQGLDHHTARHALRTTDQAHAEYARRFYGVDLGDPSLYHVVLDTTAIALDDAVDMLAAAARSVAAPVPEPAPRFRRG